ncbi:hypothetical protein PLICRDRAFT_698131 [Plicaturopsis crispa FD-325 SS-3]|nr:hypothetical protein PLICRDRAFT_698131 [Plicaturopsis crispa FD-325 SS-3]
MSTQQTTDSGSTHTYRTGLQTAALAFSAEAFCLPEIDGQILYLSGHAVRLAINVAQEHLRGFCLHLLLSDYHFEEMRVHSMVADVMSSEETLSHLAGYSLNPSLTRCIHPAELLKMMFGVMIQEKGYDSAMEWYQSFFGPLLDQLMQSIRAGQHPQDEGIKGVILKQRAKRSGSNKRPREAASPLPAPKRSRTSTYTAVDDDSWIDGPSFVDSRPEQLGESSNSSSSRHAQLTAVELGMPKAAGDAAVETRRKLQARPSM